MNNPHVQNALDLITTRDARRSGFLEYALRRNKESLPFVDRAKALKAVLVAHTTHPRDILHLTTIRESLLEAAGISVKAKAHLSEDDKQGLLVDFIEKVLLPSGGSYIDEIIYRYLLTAGDALGGKMRNIIGSIAKEKVTRFMVSQLQISGIAFSCLKKDMQIITENNVTTDVVGSVKAIRWVTSTQKKRLMVYDIIVPQVKKNIDIVLLEDDCDAFKLRNSDLKRMLGMPNHYLAMGELKGGIDPAGADEHWKTANSALGRIRGAFADKLSLMFIGAAIEPAMAAEIFLQYQSGDLANCANLTNDDQLATLCEWMVRL